MVEEDLCKKFSLNIKKFREAKGFTKGKVSEIVGCDLSYIGKLERSEKYPNLKMIFKIAQALKIQPKTLFEFE